MKITHIFWSFKFGGIETMLVNIANAQCLYGHNVSIIIINDMLDSTLISSLNKNINFVCLKRKLHTKFPYFIFKLRKEIRTIAPDIIHLHNSAFYAFMPKSMRKKCCCTLHALPYGNIKSKWYIPQWMNSLPGFISGNVNHIDKIPQIFSISNSVKNALYHKYKIQSKVIFNGILCDSFQIKSNYNYDVFKIVAIGRLDHQNKGQDILIKAINIIVNQNNFRKIQIDLIGEGESRNFLNNLILKYQLDRYITLLGSKTQEFIMKHLHEYDLFIQPSRYDGFGLTVVEAMCANVPALVSSGQGPEEVICGEKFGWVFQNGNYKDLAEKISYIINHPEESHKKSIQGLKYARNEYNVNNVAKKYIENYKLILRNSII